MARVPTVSVIVSTYRRPERLLRAVASVLAQSFEDWELLVVYDGPENAKELQLLLDACDDPRLRGFSLSEHFGSDTRPKNAGVLASVGSYIAFLDDDNTWRPDHLNVLVAALDRTTPDVCAVYGDRWMIDERGDTRPQRGIAQGYSRKRLMEKNFIDTSDVLIRREALFDVGGFDERIPKLVDWNLWVRLAKAGYSFQRVPEILTDYYRHAGSRSILPEFEYPNRRPTWTTRDVEIQAPFLGEATEPRVAVMSLTYDRLAYTRECFASLYRFAGFPFDHCVVDNGSTDGTQAWLATWSAGYREGSPFGTVELIFNPGNYGISKGLNQAVDRLWTLSNGGYDLFVLADNDAFFLTDGWLRSMVDVWKRDRRIALSCAVEGLRENAGGVPRIGYTSIGGQRIGLTRYLGGICLFVDAHAFISWRWPEDDFLHGGQDVNFCKHLRANGYRTGYLEDCVLEHYRTTAGQHVDFPGYFERREVDRRTRFQPLAR